MQRIILSGLRAESYEHPFDRSTLGGLKGTPGLEPLIHKLNEWGIEHFLKIQYTGSNVRITSDNFPEIYDMVREAAAILDLAILPDLYIQNEVGINASTLGVEKPLLVLNASCIDQLSPDELFFIIGHELGHIKSGHVLYQEIGSVLTDLSDFVSHFLAGALEVAYLNWQRMSELTADRAGLLACQNRDAAISAMIKIAGLPRRFYDRVNVDDFVAQAREFQALDRNPMDRVAKVLSAVGESHPWTVLRAAEFDSWTASGAYDRILKACGNHVNDSKCEDRFCTSCGSRLLGDEDYCPACGHKLAEDSVGAPSATNS